MKCGVAQMVFALDALAAIGRAPAGRVYVETVSEEECTGNGALATLARGYTADACFIPESTDWKMIRAQLGSVWFRLDIEGVSAHLFEGKKGRSAIMLGLVAWTSFCQMLFLFTGMRRLFDAP